MEEQAAGRDILLDVRNALQEAPSSGCLAMLSAS
jgi:hypothetical protein